MVEHPVCAKARGLQSAECVWGTEKYSGQLEETERERGRLADEERRLEGEVAGRPLRAHY